MNSTQKIEIEIETKQVLTRIKILICSAQHFLFHFLWSLIQFIIDKSLNLLIK